MSRSRLPFLVMQLRPEDVTADNEFAAIVRHGGLDAAEVERVRLEQNGLPAIDLDAYCAIIVGGSPFDVSLPEADKSPLQVRVEQGFMALFDRLAARDFPFLGACCGSGLLGRYLGAPLSGRFAEPVGGVDVSLTPAGRDDPLLTGFPDTFRVLVGHKEACDETPPGADLLVTGDACPVQMFRLGQNLYATQFHPEGDAEGFTVRIRAYRHHGYFAPEEADRIIAAVENEDTPWPKRMLARFVERYRAA